jgi:hypothetical protein
MKKKKLQKRAKWKYIGYTKSILQIPSSNIQNIPKEPKLGRRMRTCPKCGYVYTCKHGTTSRYDYYKCRCKLCRAANAKRQREWQNKHKLR